ncbi:MAG: hypothetical protein RQ760_00025 [Sedimentisphaerales bacterium]|nr:hypothetical protein [Sedimentisphaerales bacterium]
MRDILAKLTESRLYDIMASSLLTKEQSKALKSRISKKSGKIWIPCKVHTPVHDSLVNYLFVQY